MKHGPLAIPIGLLVAVIGLMLPASAEKPNVLFIAIDDLNHSVGALGGQPRAQTPHIDRLAERGMLFTNAHCAAPGCNPSRTAVMTGLYPTTSGIYHNLHDWRGAARLREVVTLPEAFRAAGYRMMGGGKLYHAHTIASSGYEGGLDARAWDVFFPSTNRQLVHESKPDPFPANGNRRFYGGVFDWHGMDEGDEAMGDTEVVAWAEKQLALKHEAPLFLGVGIYRPHVPWYVPKSYLEAYPLGDIELPKDVGMDIEDLPAAGKKMAKQEWHKWMVKEGKWREAVQAYLASASYADAMVGRLLAALDAGPLRENTLVVLWSDHGYHLGHKAHWEKFALWEQTTRVPLIMAGPGITPGRCARPVSLTDLYPTLTEWCALPKPEGVDGQSLVPLLKDPETETDRAVLTTHLRGNHAVRSQHWRYIRYADGSEELYDHRQDREEWHNLASDPEYQSVKEAHAAHLPEEEAASIENRPRRRRQRGEQDLWLAASLSRDQQIALYSLDRKEGILTLLHRTPVQGSPGSIALAPDGRHCYVAMRGGEGSVAAFRIEPDASLTALNASVVGEDPAYVSVHPSGNHVVSAYYAAGKVAVHRIEDDGSLAVEPVQVISTDERAHAAVWCPLGKQLFVPHTRPNAIFQFHFDAGTGQLRPGDPLKLLREADSGPRHLWFHPHANVAYGSDEQGRSVTSYAFHAREGVLAKRQTLSSLPSEGFEGGSTADIEAHPSGRFVYIANRGHNSIASFKVDPLDRAVLHPLEHTATEAVPRSFTISADGRFLVAAGQKTGKLAVFRIGKEGDLNRVSTIEAGQAPWWVQFLAPPPRQR